MKVYSLSKKTWIIILVRLVDLLLSAISTLLLNSKLNMHHGYIILSTPQMNGNDNVSINWYLVVVSSTQCATSN